MKNQSYEFIKGYENNHINIGFGSYGQVKLARNVQTKELVAIKIIYNKNAKQEMAVHARLEHRNIIKLLNYYYQKQKNLSYMVLEYADNGTLFDKIKSSKLSKPVIKKIFKQTCQAIQFIHQKGLMHRDIKPENVLLTKNFDAKLCDFGFAAMASERKTLCGTYQYMAPQMIQNMPYDLKIDVWALGILFFQMIEGVAPFRGDSPEQVLMEMKKNLYFSDKFDKQEIHLIKSILRVNPCNRPMLNQILEHKYFHPESDMVIKSPRVSQDSWKNNTTVSTVNTLTDFFKPETRLDPTNQRHEFKREVKLYKPIPLIFLNTSNSPVKKSTNPLNQSNSTTTLLRKQSSKFLSNQQIDYKPVVIQKKTNRSLMKNYK